MSDIPQGLLYSEEHEYLKATDEDGVYTIGITDFAQGELGDIVFLELPDSAGSVEKMDVFGTIEAVKAVSDLYAPVKGEIVEVNSALDDDPALVNSDPYGAGWMIKLRVDSAADLNALLDDEGYRSHIGE